MVLQPQELRMSWRFRPPVLGGTPPHQEVDRQGSRCYNISNTSGLLTAGGLCWRMRYRGEYAGKTGRGQAPPLLYTALAGRFVVW